MWRETTQTHIHKEKTILSFRRIASLVVGFQLSEMPLGTDTLGFGGGLSFLQAIYLGMCFTGGPAAGAKPWAYVAQYAAHLCG